MKIFLLGIYDSCAIHGIIVLYFSEKLRKLLYKSILINITLYLFSAIVTEMLILPLLEVFLYDSVYPIYILHEVFYIFWMYPIYLFVTIISVFWNKDIANETYNLVNKTRNKMDIWLNISSEIISISIICLFLIQILILSYIPILGKLLTIIQTSWYWSISSFEYKYSLEGINIMSRIKIYELDWEYMLGYGIIPSFISFYCTGYIGLSVLSLLAPIFIINSIMTNYDSECHIRLPYLYLPVRINMYLINKLR